MKLQTIANTLLKEIKKQTDSAIDYDSALQFVTGSRSWVYHTTGKNLSISDQKEITSFIFNKG